MNSRWIKLARVRSADELRDQVSAFAAQYDWFRLDLEESVEGEPSPLAAPLDHGGTQLGNRFVALPMEGWDATTQGRPTQNLCRRWRHFGLSGAAIVWGGEAYAVTPEGRANPNQLVFSEHSTRDLELLRAEVLAGAHTAAHDCPELARVVTERPLIGLQLTHAGRYARPEGRPAPRVAYRHPLLDRRR